ncbi:MAG: protein-disulfide isomerase [Erythrobacter sp. 34-65-8]|nr:MAG: protein-disulfide isomerase [Erythrobacter sp. 34-65-8]
MSGEPIAAIPAPAGQSWGDVVAKTPEGGYRLGNPDAPIKLIEFASHTCGACANFSATGAPVLKEKYVSTGVVSYEKRSLIRDPLDMTITVLARCGAPEAFHPRASQAWAALGEFGQTLNANGALMEQAMGAPEDQRFVMVAQAAGLIDWFAERGLSRDQAQACLSDSAAITALAEQSRAQADIFEVTGTPTFILNGKKLDENQWPALEPILQQAGAR